MADTSLFGPDVASVRDQLMQQDINQTNNLTPMGMAGMAGGLIGRGIGQLAGMEDPRVAEAKAVQEAVQELRSSGVDMNDPAEYFKKMAGIFGAKGLTKQAEMAAAKALEYQDKKEQRQYKLDEHKLAMEKHYVDLAEARVKLQTALTKTQGKPWQDKVDAFIKAHADKYDPATLADYVQAMNESNGDEPTALRKLKLHEKDASLAKTVEANGRMYVYNPEAAAANPGKTHPTMKDYVDAGVASERAPQVKIINPAQQQESEYAKSSGRLGAEAIPGLVAKQQAAQAELAGLEQLRPLIGNMRSGLGADVLQYVDQFAAQFGGGEALRTAVNNRAQFNKIVGQMLLTRIKKLGANPSDADRNFIEKILPNARDPKEALSAAINYFGKVAQEEIEDSENMAKQIHANKGLVNSEGTLVKGRRTPITQASKPLADYSDDELKAAIEAKRKKQ